MKKRMMSIMILSVCLCFLLTGCSGGVNNSGGEKLSQFEKDKIENAQTVYEISSLLTRTSDLLKYSECPNDDEFSMYFDLLGTHDYFVMPYGDEKYVLFLYAFSGYGETLSSITEIVKEYDSPNEGNLNLTVNNQIEYTEQDGCFPEITSARCIVKLDKDIKSLSVDGTAYNEYKGGYINVGDRYGVADADLNIIVPIQYETIRDFETFGTDKHYYFIVSENGAGVMNENYETIISPKYENIFFVNDSKFVVGKGPRDEVGLENAQIGILNQDEELIHEYIDGFIDGSESFDNDVHQVVFGRMSGDKYLQGVIDDDLNIIIEPEYQNITVFKIELQKDQFYVVENDKSEFAVIDSSGKQQTEFEPTSVYEVQTNYYESLEKSGIM